MQRKGILSKEKGGKVAHKPGSVETGHSSGTTVTHCLERSTRMLRASDPYSPKRNAPLFDLAPEGVCHAGHVAMSPVSSCLPISPLPGRAGRYLSVALSVKSPFLAVSQPPALWSPDFPPAITPAAGCATFPRVSRSRFFSPLPQGVQPWYHG